MTLRHIFYGHRGGVLERKNGFTSEQTPYFDNLESHDCSAVCASKECIKTAAFMLSMMDTKVDPCEDFYSYACGGYDKVVMSSKKKEYVINDLAQEVLNPVKDILESLPVAGREGELGSCFTKARKFYDSCMNLRSSEEMAIPTALKYLEFFGIRNWPQLSDDYRFTDPDLDETISRMSLYNMLLFYSIGPFENEEEEEEDIQTLDTTATVGHERKKFKMQIPVRYSQIFHMSGYVSDDTRRSIDATLDYFQITGNISKQIIQDVMMFDQGILNITQETTQRREECEMNDTIDCSAYLYDCSKPRNLHANRWCKIARNFLVRSGFMKKYPDTNIILQDGQHFRNLQQWFDRTSHKTIAHALALKFFVDNAVAMNFLLRRRATYYDMFATSVEDMPESPSLYCAAWVSKRLPVLIGTAFYNAIHESKIHEEVKEIYSDIQESLVSIVETTPWLDEEVKAAAEQLILNITLSGDYYLRYVKNVSATDEFYAQLQVTEESFLANELEAKKFVVSTAVKSLDNVTELEFLTKSSFELNPTYAEGIINLEIGSHLFPLVAIGRSRYSNLGAFGGIVGHELSHALEMFLRGYENRSKNFEEAFEKRRTCLSQHFSEYEIDSIGEKVDGNNTFNENLADYYGFRAIFKSLRKYQEQRGYIERVPGLKFDNEQILFVTYAQLWCETNTLDSLKLYTQDSHSPAKYRVWGVYRNFEPFADAFSCPLGSPMNPVTKCNFES